jgi:hypothetical protein
LNYGSGAYIATSTTVLPSAPGTPVTANSGSNVIVTWTAPTTGTPILNYTIMIGTSTGTWATTSSCDGASATTIANL